MMRATATMIGRGWSDLADQARLRAILPGRVQGRRPRADDRGRSKKVQEAKRGARSQRRRNRAPRDAVDSRVRPATQGSSQDTGRAHEGSRRHGNSGAPTAGRRCRGRHGRRRRHCHEDQRRSRLGPQRQQGRDHEVRERDQVSPPPSRRLQAVVLKSIDRGRQGSDHGRRVLVRPSTAAPVRRHRVRTGWRSATLLQSLAGVHRRTKERRLLEVPGSRQGQRCSRRRGDVSSGSSAGGRRYFSSPPSRWKQPRCCGARSARARPKSGR